jgi:hypothetical protein
VTDPATDPSDPTAAQDLAREVAVRVAEATARGEYPDGVDDDLLTEFARLVDRRVGTSPFARLRDEVPALRDLAHLAVVAPATTSRIPGGAQAHEAVGRLVARQVTPLTEATRAFAKATAECLALVAAGLDDEDPGHAHPELHGVLDAVLDRLAELERRLPAPGGDAGGPAAALVASTSPRLVVAEWDDGALATCTGLGAGALGGLAVEHVGPGAAGTATLAVLAATAAEVLRPDGVLAVGDPSGAALGLLGEHGFADVVASGTGEGLLVRGVRAR